MKLTDLFVEKLSMKKIVEKDNYDQPQSIVANNSTCL